MGGVTVWEGKGPSIGQAGTGKQGAHTRGSPREAHRPTSEGDTEMEGVHADHSVAAQILREAYGDGHAYTIGE